MSEDEITQLRKLPFLVELKKQLADLPRSLVHRDFQSENVMVRDGQVFLIDYQGLRFGRPEYDVASLIYDPYVPLKKEEREQLITHYQRQGGEDSDVFQTCLAKCAAQRLMQALGAYGNLGLNLGKPHYLKFILPAMDNLIEATSSLPEFAPIRDLQGRIRITGASAEGTP